MTQLRLSVHCRATMKNAEEVMEILTKRVAEEFDDIMDDMVSTMPMMTKLLKLRRKCKMPRVIATNGIADFNAIRLTVASPKISCAGVTVKLLNLKPLIIGLKNLNVTDFSAKEFSDRSKMLIRMTTN
jgi:hypothetical protein